MQRALAIAEKALGPEHPNVARALNNLAGFYFEKGDYARAEPLLQRALATGEKALGPEHPTVATALNNLGGLYLLARAEPLLQRALAIREKALGPEHPEVARTLHNFAGLRWAQGNLDQALSLLGRANTVRERNLALGLATGSEEQKRAYMALYSGETSGTLAFHLGYAPKDPEAARLALTTLLQRKGRVLEVMSEGVAALRQRLNRTDQTLFDQLMEQRTQLAALLVKGPGQAAPETYQVQVDKIKAEAEALEARISARSAEFRAQTQTVSLEQVQRVIPEGAALVELALYRSFDPEAPAGKGFGAQRYAAYVLHPQGEPGWVDLGEAAPINRAIEAFRAAIDSKLHALEKRARTPSGDGLPKAARGAR